MPFDREAVLAKFREFEDFLREGEQVPTEYLPGGLYITRSEPGKGPQDAKYTERIREALRDLLGLADVTEACRAYIEENVMVTYRMGLPFDTALRALLTEPEEGNYGIFDPAKAEQIERGMQRAALFAEMLPERREVVKMWGKQIEQKYGKK